MAFFGGSTGVIYRQFSITIVSAMALSILVALVLAYLCAVRDAAKANPGRAARNCTGVSSLWFNRSFERTREKYHATVEKLFGRIGPAMTVYGIIVLAMIVLFIRLPTGFLPEEDQGAIDYAQFTLPAGAIRSRTLDVAKQVGNIVYMVDERANVDTTFGIVVGFSFAGAGQNSGLSLCASSGIGTNATTIAQAIAHQRRRMFSKIRDAQVFTAGATGGGNAAGHRDLRSRTRATVAI